MEKLFKHMAWANQEILKKVQELPDEALDAFIVNPEWTVREISRHIASSATWYGWRLLDKSNFSDVDSARWQEILDETEIPAATSAEIVKVIERVRKADHILLEESRKSEADVKREWKGQIIVRKRSTILSQAIYHATEHRAQMISALEYRGYGSINLDSYDLWNFADTIGE